MRNIARKNNAHKRSTHTQAQQNNIRNRMLLTQQEVTFTGFLTQLKQSKSLSVNWYGVTGGRSSNLFKNITETQAINRSH